MNQLRNVPQQCLRLGVRISDKAVEAAVHRAYARALRVLLALTSTVLIDAVEASAPFAKLHAGSQACVIAIVGTACILEE